MKRFRLPILVLLLLALAACAAPERSMPSADEAAALTFDTVDTAGNRYTSDRLKDYDLTVVNIWAYWCGPCVRELPELEQLHESLPGVQVLGVLADTGNPDETLRIMNEAGVTYPVVYPEGDLKTLVDGCRAIPTTYFFASDGTLLGGPEVGAHRYADWETIVAGLLE